MAGEEDLVVTARVLPENREVYETLIKMSETKGIGQDEVNTHLFNAGLFVWVEKISKNLDEGPPEPKMPV
jgi:hypothetical protein